MKFNPVTSFPYLHMYLLNFASAFYIVLIVIFVLAISCEQANVETENKRQLSNEFWTVEFDHIGITGLMNSMDNFKANLVADDEILDTQTIFRINEGEWQSVFKRFSGFYRPPEHEPSYARQFEQMPEAIQYKDFKPGMPFSLTQTFTLNGHQLDWDIELENQMNYEIEIGDLGIDIPWRMASGETQIELFEGSFTRSHFISGDGSFLIYTKRSGEPPYMILTVKPDTHLEYFRPQGNQSYRAYIHSGFSGESETRGTWRQPHTSEVLMPNGENGDKLSYGFQLQWADSYDELRDILYENHLIDVRVVPGMTLPSDLEAKFSLRTKASIDSVVAEFPAETEIHFEGEKKPDHHVYSVRFHRLGENMITVHFDGNRKTYLEFFSTEPVETLLEKRAKFIVENQQHRNPELWYDGLFSIWDMKNEVLRGPDNTDGYEGWWGYMVASDDPVLGIAPFLASVNELDPDPEQIEALEYHIENFVWGGLQRTADEEPYPYGIYGVPNWKVARDSLQRAQMENRRLDRMKIWRAYDYPHLFMLYYHMYRIADRFPDLVNYLDAEGYLERTWQTARAFFEYPYEIYPWYDIYKWGFYNEMLIPDIIETLNRHNRTQEAEWLREEWEKKVKYFVYDDPYPYRSEYPYDRTAFESTYALAKYGATREMEPGDSLWYDVNENKWYSYDQVKKEDAREFMDRQHLAGLAVRGWLEPKYFLMGSDFTTSPDRHTLSYMARMGGWSILDYGLQFSPDPHDWLQLGYASYLSSFALMNTGTSESNYGYWYPGESNDGALGMAFMSAKHGFAWIQKNEDRGAWRYDGEQNLGMSVVTRTATTILAEDPLFGWIAYGGKLETGDNEFKLWPRDGVRLRFRIINDQMRFGLELDRDGWSDKQPITISDELDHLELVLENRTGTQHTTRLAMNVQDDSDWELRMDGETVNPGEINNRLIFELNVSNSEHLLEVIRQ